MEGQTMLGRGIAGVGVVLGFLGIWVSYGGGQAYWDDGTFGGLLLILAILGVLALGGALSTGRREYDVAVGAIGGVMFGMYLFIPALLAFDQWDLLDTGAWLGMCSALMFIGAQIATWPTDRPAGRPMPMAMLLAVVGLVLVFVGIFPTAEKGFGSYWNYSGAGHSFGILLIILVVLEALSLAAAWMGAAALDSAVFVGAVTVGSAIALPVGKAFGELGDIGTGGWLAGIGGVVLAVGIWAMWQMRTADVPAAAPAPTPPAA